MNYKLILVLLAAVCCPGCKQKTRLDSSLPVSIVQPSISHTSIADAASFSDILPPPQPETTPTLLDCGKNLYAQNCSACHGIHGDAKSDAAAFLLPKPRNFVEARYRLHSTDGGQLPTDVDLYRSITLGLPGTPMPAWRHSLSETEVWALVAYIKNFSPRFEDPHEIRRIVNLGHAPERSGASIAEGKSLYYMMSCNSCHGDSGRGDGPASFTLIDDAGTAITPRDFTKPGTFKSGYSTQDMVRTILTGFEGTPMISFGGILRGEDAWKVAYFLETLARPISVPDDERFIAGDSKPLVSNSSYETNRLRGSLRSLFLQDSAVWDRTGVTPANSLK